MNNLIDPANAKNNVAVPYNYVEFPKCLYRRNLATQAIESRVFADEAELAQSKTAGDVWFDTPDPAVIDKEPFNVDTATRAELISTAKAFGFDGEPPDDMSDDAIRSVVRDAIKPKSFAAPAPATPAPADDTGGKKGKGKGSDA